jgi:peptidyl-prolyl cis-trans isomerase B (cyclophilin B)
MRPRILLLLAVLALAACGGDDEEEAAPTTTADGGSATGCRDVGQPEAKPEGTGAAPTAILDATKTYRAVVTTSCGSFTITLDPKAAPKTVSSFVALAEDGFYDQTVFHRIVPNFVIQGGDPTGTGRGGPGYTTVDTPKAGTTYTHGTVAMAKTAAEAPGTAGSQFFVVTAPDAGLPAEYAVIGKVTGGLDVVDRIGLLGDPTTELPMQPVVIDSIAIETS